jgi:hypothetical protein
VILGVGCTRNKTLFCGYRDVRASLQMICKESFIEK